jgi:hypothetical protein
VRSSARRAGPRVGDARREVGSGPAHLVPAVTVDPGLDLDRWAIEGMAVADGERERRGRCTRTWGDVPLIDRDASARRREHWHHEARHERGHRQRDREREGSRKAPAADRVGGAWRCDGLGQRIAPGMWLDRRPRARVRPSAPSGRPAGTLVSVPGGTIARVDAPVDGEPRGQRAAWTASRVDGARGR